MSGRAAAWVTKPSQGDLAVLETAKGARFYVVKETGPTQFMLRRMDSDAELLPDATRYNNASEATSENSSTETKSASRAPPAPNGASALQSQGSQLIRVAIGNPHRCSCQGPTTDSLCVHVLFILRNVFNVAPTSPLLYQRALTDHEIDNLLRARQAKNIAMRRRNRADSSLGGGQASAAGGSDSSLGSEGNKESPVLNRRLIPKHAEDPSEFVCSVCYEPMTYVQQRDGALFFCDGPSGCGNPTHVKCLLVWVRHRLKVHDNVTCPLCRAVLEAKDIEASLQSQLSEANKIAEARRQRRLRAQNRAQHIYWRSYPCTSCKLPLNFTSLHSNALDEDHSTSMPECSVHCMLCSQELLCLGCFLSSREDMVRTWRSSQISQTHSGSPATAFKHHHVYALRFPIYTGNSKLEQPAGTGIISSDDHARASLGMLVEAKAPPNNDARTLSYPLMMLSDNRRDKTKYQPSLHPSRRSIIAMQSPQNDLVLSGIALKGRTTLLDKDTEADSTNNASQIQQTQQVVDPKIRLVARCRAIFGRRTVAAITSMVETKSIADPFTAGLLSALERVLDRQDGLILSTRSTPKWLLLGTPAMWLRRSTFETDDFVLLTSHIYVPKPMREIKKLNNSHDAKHDETSDSHDSDEESSVQTTESADDPPSDSIVGQSETANAVYILQQLRGMPLDRASLFECAVHASTCQITSMEGTCSQCHLPPPDKATRYNPVYFMGCKHWLHAHCALGLISKVGLPLRCRTAHNQSRGAEPKVFLFVGLFSPPQPQLRRTRASSANTNNHQGQQQQELLTLAAGAMPERLHARSAAFQNAQFSSLSDGPAAFEDSRAIQPQYGPHFPLAAGGRWSRQSRLRKGPTDHFARGSVAKVLMAAHAAFSANATSSSQDLSLRGLSIGPVNSSQLPPSVTITDSAMPSRQSLGRRIVPLASILDAPKESSLTAGTPSGLISLDINNSHSNAPRPKQRGTLIKGLTSSQRPSSGPPVSLSRRGESDLSLNVMRSIASEQTGRLFTISPSEVPPAPSDAPETAVAQTGPGVVNDDQMRLVPRLLAMIDDEAHDY